MIWWEFTALFLFIWSGIIIGARTYQGSDVHALIVLIFALALSGFIVLQWLI